MDKLTLPLDYASRNFKWSEFECKCGCGTKNVSGRAVEALQKLRDMLGTPLVVTSAARCEAHNKAVGGAPKSSHLSGSGIKSHAFDVLIPKGMTQETFVQNARVCGFTGIGWGASFTHIDMRDRPADWNY